MTEVRVNLMEDPRLPAGLRRFIRVELFSARILATGKLKSQADIYPYECGSEREFERKIEAVAGAMAENQCEKYGDVHNPSDVARAAREAFRELKLDQRWFLAPPQERGDGTEK